MKNLKQVIQDYLAKHGPVPNITDGSAVAYAVGQAMEIQRAIDMARNGNEEMSDKDYQAILNNDRLKAVARKVIEKLPEFRRAGEATTREMVCGDPWGPCLDDFNSGDEEVVRLLANLLREEGC